MKESTFLENHLQQEGNRFEPWLSALSQCGRETAIEGILEVPSRWTYAVFFRLSLFITGAVLPELHQLRKR
jgi:hypothetical protein